jgi:ClpP class serine protease
MRMEHILSEVYDRPWLITKHSHANIRRIVEWRMEMTAAEWQARKREGETISGDKVELDSMTVDKGVARIPFAGVLIKGAAAWEKGSGALSHADVEVDIREALADPHVKAILYDVDSPGGTAAGSFELASLIAEADKVKPSMAWVEGICCSAAFLCMSGARMIYGALTSEVGAIECYMPFIDRSMAYKERGYEVDIIKPDQSVHAAAGYPGTSLTAEQRDLIKSQVADLLDMYVAHLKEVRPKISEDMMDGRTLIGARAIDGGMMDAITTKDQAMRDLRKWAGLT